MKSKSRILFPCLLAAGVILAAVATRWLQPQFLETLEARTYDWRAKLAVDLSSTTVTNLGFVAITDASIERIRGGVLQDGPLKLRYGLYWPRHIYGRLLRELSAQGATAVGFDILFAGLRPDHSPILVATNAAPDLSEFLRHLHPQSSPLLLDNQVNVESDDFFAWQLHRTGIGIVAAEKETLPHPLFRNQAAAIGDIAAERDPDGILRRVRPFRIYRVWHPLIEHAASEYDLDLSKAEVTSNHITLNTPDNQIVKIPLAADGTFDPKDFGGNTAAGLPRAKPFTDQRIWHMGIVLAARQLGLDLEHAEIDSASHKITLHGRNGCQRILPLDANGYLIVDWQLPVRDKRLTAEPVEQLLAQDIARRAGETNLPSPWNGKLVVVGSTATGNDLTDLGTTPLEKETVLMSKHWNVANSILTGRFIQPTTLAQDCLIILLLGSLSATLTLRFRILSALASVAAAAILYIGLATAVYLQQRLWLPLILPVSTLAAQYTCLITWRVVFEQGEKRRVRSIFSKIVAPQVVNELLASDTVSLGGTRREVTVLFADVRGFTAFTDNSREEAARVARENNLTSTRAEEHFEREARETLNTVNTYLALVADIVKQHGGTLDKYIGDCVMAFWNAPATHPHHALVCVQAAIDAQRAVARLNEQRQEENKRREQENTTRIAASQTPLPLLPILNLGTGINTGQVIVGLMGSDAHILNYTVFGREVNLASRLESLSGHGRIIIGQTTHATLLVDDPTLAASCKPLDPVTVKGIREPVQVFEVPWQLSGQA